MQQPPNEDWKLCFEILMMIMKSISLLLFIYGHQLLNQSQIVIEILGEKNRCNKYGALCTYLCYVLSCWHFYVFRLTIFFCNVLLFSLYQHQSIFFNLLFHNSFSRCCVKPGQTIREKKTDRRPVVWHTSSVKTSRNFH